MTCRYFDCGWCYAPEDVENNSKNGSCNEPLSCPYLKENKMTERAQKVIDAAHRVVDGGVPLGKLIREGKKNPMLKKTHYEFAAVLREVVEQYRVGGLLYCADVLELADELEAL